MTDSKATLLMIHGIDHFELADVRDTLHTMYEHAELMVDALALEMAVEAINHVLCRVRRNGEAR